ncbi:MAG TPA: tRNA epoxyqueuosine(34) reductase QueG [Opitutaceae bacterium]|nr:tRNA epoxyqueuosine(34) reductase QueG [Opitutaceae bacterium]
MDAVRQEELRRRLHALGFDAVRFARLDGGTPGADALRAWLAAGRQADMAWMERTADKRIDPQLVLPGARSIIVLGVNYWPSEEKSKIQNPKSKMATWARYALYEDYHDTIKPALVAAGHALEELGGGLRTDYRYFVDTGPVLERGWAARAGLGFIGKNAMLISRRYGNWLFLAAIFTRVEFTPDPPLRGKPETRNSKLETPVGALCGKCTRCMDACPTQALPAPGVVEARRCISYLTIENRGVIPREFRRAIGDRIYGCDICAEVCPWNRFAQESRRLLLVARQDLGTLPLRELLALTPERFAGIFRHTPIKRLKLAGLLRNACVVAGNSGDTNLIEPLVQLAAHASPLVRAHAVWAVYRLVGEVPAGLPAAAGKFLQAARAAETDATVLAEYAAGSAGD